MDSSIFEERFRACRGMPGKDDPAYRSACNEMVEAAGGSIVFDGNTSQETLERIDAATADDRNREWTGVGSSPMDLRLGAFADLYSEADDVQREVLRDFFEGEALRHLEHFVARAARLLEHSGDSRWLSRGLAAACIDDGRYDFRDLIASLSILRYGATREGINFYPYFKDALWISAPVDDSAIAPQACEVLNTVIRYPKRTLRHFVRQFGPPEWRDEVKPWWKFWQR